MKIGYHGNQTTELILTHAPLYCTNNYATAEGFAKEGIIGKEINGIPTVHKLKLTMNNPKIIHNSKEYYQYFDAMVINNVIPQLKAQGFDSMIYIYDKENKLGYYVVFDAKEQCKILKTTICESTQKKNIDFYKQYNHNIFETLNKELERYL